ncbi:DnaJ homolog subfamily A member 1 [Eumeta japonica]|uniref:DnaJ homolog subfamily A member 1 n=1 Tax=Eumeta variegata TaxID=151549 RepID=A0A4C1TIS6_EUMVA|nr:DnaJ homolog subfamily A member 1 [Eumeta japonica]
MDFFERFFGGGFSSNRRRERRGKDVVHQLSVQLEELYNGATEIGLQKMSYVISVKVEGVKGAIEKCMQCRGTGLETRMHQIGASLIQHVEQV